MARGAPGLAALVAPVSMMALLGGCSRRAPLASCDDDLQGVYAAGAERWMVLDRGTTLEAYPLVPDPAEAGSASEVAPRLIDLARPGLAGTLRRRYMQRDARCDAQVPVRITRCAGETIELVLADPAPPIGFTPCAWPRAGSSRIARWVRQ